MRSLIKKIIEHFRKILFRKRFFEHQKNTFDSSKRIIRKARKLGFTADEYIIYDLEHNNPNDYLSEFERYSIREKLIERRIVCDNKILFYEICRNFADMNTIFCYKQQGKFVSLDRECTEKTLIEFIGKHNAVCLKKTSAGGGEGFNLIQKVENIWYINKQMRTLTDVQNLLNSNNWLLEEYCRQSEWAASFNPSSVNTLRIITIKNDDRKIEIPFAFFRMGSNGDSVIDNASQNGIFSIIDITTGQLSIGYASYSKQYVQERFERHPATGVQIKGAVIPNFKTIKRQLIQLHEKLLFTGLDFLI